jgi:hypothetical protein
MILSFFEKLVLAATVNIRKETVILEYRMLAS